ncbi:MAG: hypothetical protein LQ347_004239 [Umbilicaria vellea]|nr:MAG: hypothetical protein LQ347_004239 [Umbilicaria vellea]
MAEHSRPDFSDASHSTTLSEGMARALAFAPSSRPSSPLSKEEPEPPSPTSSEHPSEILRRQLSIHSVISTTSSFAERMNRASGRTEDQEYRIIGLGSCGSVFEIPGTEIAVKKGKDLDAVWNDFILTNTVHNAHLDLRNLLQEAFPSNTAPKTPLCTFFHLPTSRKYWDTHLHKFPASHREVGATFQVERILPLPQSIREALIDLYFDEEIQEEAKNDEESKACLVRIYLGENEIGVQDYDSLRNFPLRLNMVEDLGLEKAVIADEMAIALASIHWQAQVDAMDAEFVIGSARAVPPGEIRGYQLDGRPQELATLDFKQRSIHLWVLDFDKSSRIKLTSEDVEKCLVPAFLCNDPYYPRPDVDADLWERFKHTYLKASRLILSKKQMSDSVMHLPRLFLDKVASQIKENEDWDPEEQVMFR